MKLALAKIVEGQGLGEAEAFDVMSCIMRGEATPSQTAGLLIALRMKGESVDEVSGFARAMRVACRAIHPKVQGRLVDTCSTGGARIKVFNVGTTAAFVAAAAGVPIAKHGNRGVTRASGSADILEALGADLSLQPEQVQAIIERIGIGFLFAPTFHPAMVHPLAPRREMGVRTVFNILGPLTNPANAKGHVLGVYAEGLMDPMAEALRRLGVERAMVVHGEGDLDELSTLGPTDIIDLADGKLSYRRLQARDLGLARARPEDVANLPPALAAQEARAILGGKPGPRADMVALAASAAAVVGGKASTLEDGLKLARETMANGAGLRKLDAFVEATKEAHGPPR
ncbi:MAG TPA: anthranilate phosphoribosyltransferase [Candidatus Thermoplasmatota archaeon]|nr:anthranilate phosphoribosyltransferase [Candidatus Thermoplasmatota archaeon]